MISMLYVKSIKEVKSIMQGISRQLALLTSAISPELYASNHFGQVAYPDQVNSLNMIRNKPANNPYSNTYNQGWRDHLKFSWA